MHGKLFKTVLLAILVLVAGFSQAQKNIVISDSLAANADKLNVKLGTQWMGKMWKFHFGDYAVVSSKLGWMVTNSKGNFFNTKTESKSTEKFSFLLAGKTTDSARVNAARNIQVQALREAELFRGFTIGNNELLLEAQNFTAFITINEDTSDVWALVMNTAQGSQTPGKYEAYLTNGQRKIVLVPASSDTNGGNSRSMPALGYTFVEEGQSLGALQYYGGGLMGMNKNIVWLRKDLDERLKLILAAAMTAVLQIKVAA